MATQCEELTDWKRRWCWERLKVGGEGDDSGWDGWLASLTQWAWVWASSRSWWWTGRPGVLRFMGSQRVRYDWATELNWTELNHGIYSICNSLSTFLMWVNSGCWQWTGRHVVLQSLGLQRFGHNWATELNWNLGIYTESKKARGISTPSIPKYCSF